jgi:hypothetical protein
MTEIAVKRASEKAGTRPEVVETGSDSSRVNTSTRAAKMRMAKRAGVAAAMRSK